MCIAHLPGVLALWSANSGQHGLAWVGGLVNPLGNPDHHDTLYHGEHVLIVNIDRPVKHIRAQVEQESLTRMQDKGLAIIFQNDAIGGDTLRGGSSLRAGQGRRNGDVRAVTNDGG